MGKQTSKGRRSASAEVPPFSYRHYIKFSISMIGPS